MNPTLWGLSRNVSCPTCDVVTRVDQGFIDRCTTISHAAKAICWHCGDAWPKDVLLTAPAIPPDVLRVVSTPIDSAQTGDWLLLQQHGQTHVKRMLGRPGQIIDRTATGLLHVDGREFCPPGRVIVDDDSHRRESRWIASTQGDQVRWTYHHRSVYRGAASPVLDDVPGNLGVRRVLRPVERIGVSVRITGRWPVCPVRAEFTLAGGGVVAPEPQAWSADRDDQQVQWIAPENTLAALTAEPVALVFKASDGDHIHERLVWRPIRIADDDAPTDRYPIVLGKDQWFVIGDNGPVAVDSRTWGPIGRDWIRGLAAVSEQG